MPQANAAGARALLDPAPTLDTIACMTTATIHEQLRMNATAGSILEILNIDPMDDFHTGSCREILSIAAATYQPRNCAQLAAALTAGIIDASIDRANILSIDDYLRMSPWIQHRLAHLPCNCTPDANPDECCLGSRLATLAAALPPLRPRTGRPNDLPPELAY